MSSIQFAVGCLPVVGPALALYWHETEGHDEHRAAKKATLQWVAENLSNPNPPPKPSYSIDQVKICNSKITFAKSVIISSILTIALIISVFVLSSLVIPLFVVIGFACIYGLSVIAGGLCLYLDKNKLAEEMSK